MDSVSCFNRRTIAIASALLLSSPALSSAAQVETQSPSRRRGRQPQTKEQRRQERRKQQLSKWRQPPIPPSTINPPFKHSADGNNSQDQHSVDKSQNVPTFSCGSIFGGWSTATECSTLCPTGECPSGQQCYAGIPCPQHLVEEKQREMELAYMKANMERMEEEFVGRFACGTSYEEAVLSCRGASTSGEISAVASAANELHFCPSGQSDECPSNMDCFAAVSCPHGTISSSSFDSDRISSSSDEVVILDATNILHNNLSSFLTTEPILFNSTNTIMESSSSLMVLSQEILGNC